MLLIIFSLFFLSGSMWQQAGRAGRRERASVSVYVAFGGPLDQYFMRCPEKLFSRAIENAQVDSQNPEVWTMGNDRSGKENKDAC